MHQCFTMISGFVHTEPAERVFDLNGQSSREHVSHNRPSLGNDLWTLRRCRYRDLPRCYILKVSSVRSLLSRFCEQQATCIPQTVERPNNGYEGCRGWLVRLLTNFYCSSAYMDHSLMYRSLTNACLRNASCCKSCCQVIRWRVWQSRDTACCKPSEDCVKPMLYAKLRLYRRLFVWISRFRILFAWLPVDRSGRAWDKSFK